MSPPGVLTKEQLARFNMPFQDMMEEFGYADTESPNLAGTGGLSGKIFDGLVAVGNFLTDTGDEIVDGVGNVKKWAYQHFQFFMGIGVLFLTLLIMLLCLKLIFKCGRIRRQKYQNISWNPPRGKTANNALITSYDVE